VTNCTHLSVKAVGTLSYYGNLGG